MSVAAPGENSRLLFRRSLVPLSLPVSPAESIVSAPRRAALATAGDVSFGHPVLFFCLPQG